MMTNANADAETGVSSESSGLGAVTAPSGLQAHPDAPGQAEGRSALAALRESSQARKQPWWVDFEELLQQGWEWRKAVLIAWEGSPCVARWPATQGELATQVLGLRGDRAIQKWRRNDPEIERAVAMAQAAPLLRHRRAIYDALVTVASLPTPRGHPDRKLALEMMGDYRPSGRLALSGPNGDDPVAVVGFDLSKLSDDELDALDRLTGRIAGNQNGEGQAPAN